MLKYTSPRPTQAVQHGCLGGVSLPGRETSPTLLQQYLGRDLSTHRYVTTTSRRRRPFYLKTIEQRAGQKRPHRRKRSPHLRSCRPKLSTISLQRFKQPMPLDTPDRHQLECQMGVWRRWAGGSDLRTRKHMRRSPENVQCGRYNHDINQLRTMWRGNQPKRRRTGRFRKRR